jgi:hypothetical protein
VNSNIWVSKPSRVEKDLYSPPVISAIAFGGEWKASSQPAWLTPQMFSEKIQPALAQTSATAIAKRIGVSRWYAGPVREGYRPHPRHWEALATLVGFTAYC